ncbi:MAG: guanylate kinase [Thermodesulfobacteriota bacterium]
MGGRVFVISGPSGSGKSTIIKENRKRIDNLTYSVSHTSRRPRGAEKDGVEYHFVDRDTFRAMIDRNEFAEWAQVFQDYYGTSFCELQERTSQGLDVIMDLDVQGAVNMRLAVNDCVLVFILPPSMEVLEERLRARGTDDSAAVARRMERAAAEIMSARQYDFLIVNDRLDRAVEEMASIILADRCRIDRRIPEVEAVFYRGNTLRKNANFANNKTKTPDFR